MQTSLFITDAQEMQTQEPSKMPTLAELKKLVKEKKIQYLVINGQKVRPFVASVGILAAFGGKSRTRGYSIENSTIEDIVYSKTTKEQDVELEMFKTIQKFYKNSLKATFTNEFIKCCKNLPQTIEQWIEQGKKSAYEYNVTTGCKITGQLVSVDTICKKIQSEELKRAIAECRPYTARFEYDGYDGSVSIEVDNPETRSMRVYLNKEYRNCGNGYYYLLINDEYFIGYDVD